MRILLGFIVMVLQKSISTVLSARPKLRQKILLWPGMNHGTIYAEGLQDTYLIIGKTNQEPEKIISVYFSSDERKWESFFFLCKGKKPLFQVHHGTHNWMLSFSSF